jgi:hypothetical protein
VLILPATPTYLSVSRLILWQTLICRHAPFSLRAVSYEGKKQREQTEGREPFNRRQKGSESGLAAPDKIRTARFGRLMAQQFFNQHQTQCERGTRQQAQPGFKLRGCFLLCLEAFAAI